MPRWLPRNERVRDTLSKKARTFNLFLPRFSLQILRKQGERVYTEKMPPPVRVETPPDAPTTIRIHVSAMEALNVSPFRG